MCDFRICTELLLIMILSLGDLPQNQSLETIQVCIVVLCFPHNYTVGIHLCDECTRSNAPNVFQMLLSISLPHEQACSQNIKCQVLPIRARYIHLRTICEQTVDNSPTDSFSSSFNLWSSMHGAATFLIVELFYSQIRNIFPHISLHDLPCRRTKKIWLLHQVSLKLLYVNFPRLQQKSRLQT